MYDLHSVALSTVSSNTVFVTGLNLVHEADDDAVMSLESAVLAK